MMGLEELRQPAGICNGDQPDFTHQLILQAIKLHSELFQRRHGRVFVRMDAGLKIDHWGPTLVIDELG